MKADNLFVEAYNDGSNSTWISIENLVILFIYRLIETDTVELYVSFLPKKLPEQLMSVSLESFKYETPATTPDIFTFASAPVIVSGKQVIAGVCSVARSLIKCSPLEHIKSLLGFKEACLLACSENSVWTMFCEIEIMLTIKDIINKECFIDGAFELPDSIARFEYHMSRPVKMHNIYKEARIKNKDKKIKSGTPMKELNLNHVFCEGLFMTLTDVILYQCFEVIFKYSPIALSDRIPLISAWYKKMDDSKIAPAKFQIEEKTVDAVELITANIERFSLYKSDPVRYKPEKRIFTKQTDIDLAYEQLKQIKEDIVNQGIPFGDNEAFNWSDVPLEANPNGGALPKSRANRKCEQLVNLTKAVLKIAKNQKYKIVDFCSGSGHLGILIATLLPECEIILVENKEKSLARAKERIEKLDLSNVLIVQSNLDYFVGNFDIGVALHACGVATDLVIQNCIKTKAHIVVCPCCYGGVHNCPRLNYPRSDRFKKANIDYKMYLNLAHAADQTHEEENVKTKQGYFCMDAIDCDRKFYMESFGYDVYLGKLKPLTCTNKNNLLVGLLGGKPF